MEFDTWGGASTAVGGAECRGRDGRTRQGQLRRGERAAKWLRVKRCGMPGVWPWSECARPHLIEASSSHRGKARQNLLVPMRKAVSGRYHSNATHQPDSELHVEKTPTCHEFLNRPFNQMHAAASVGLSSSLYRSSRTALVGNEWHIGEAGPTQPPTLLQPDSASGGPYQPLPSPIPPPPVHSASPSMSA